ncbi:MAG TPA: hypothetical protein VMF09_15495 [Solirubrobacteraceae bacterium]|nr:hypothetical protein [Solirubrobacteraceae bacterium]
MAETLTGRGGPTQQRVRQALARLGGYWRPLAALARILEELGELAEIIAAQPGAGEALASELADLWIITAALGDQFLADVAEPDSLSAPARADVARPSDPIARLAVSAGRVARIVNYYDGPKAPRSLEGWTSLEQELGELHRLLAALAHAHGVDLAAAVAAKLDAIAVRDAGRFRRGSQDPSTAPCLEWLRALPEPAAGLDPREARLWGAPAPSLALHAGELEAIVAALVSFTRAAPHERLDACVVPCPRIAPAARLGAWLERLLREIAARDPARAGPSAERGRAPGMRFTFNAVELDVELFSAPAGGLQPRRPPSDTFVVFAMRAER